MANAAVSLEMYSDEETSQSSTSSRTSSSASSVASVSASSLPLTDSQNLSKVYKATIGYRHQQQQQQQPHRQQQLVPLPSFTPDSPSVSSTSSVPDYSSPTATPSTSSLFTFTPFPKYSVNIVTGPTFVGKTYFITQLVNHYKTYFAQDSVHRVVVVLCNSRVKSIVFSPDLDIPVEQVLLSDFVPDQLEPNDLVIIDDLQNITPAVKLTISVCAHHQGLAALFVVTHSLLGSANFELLKLSHRVFLFLGSTANNRLTLYLLDNFYTDPEVKTYLKSVLNFCSDQNEILALELSPIGPSPRVLVAFSHLIHLSQPKSNYCLLYPWPHFGKNFVKHFEPQSSAPVALAHTDMSISFLSSDSTRNLPNNTLIALPVKYVKDQIKSRQQEGEGSGSTQECANRQHWEATLEDIEDNIESFFPLKRWKMCKNLAKEILSNVNFCITNDGKYFHVVDRPKTKVNLLSFLGLATRKAGPSEKAKKPEWKMYNPHIQLLVANGTPKELFVNKLLLQNKSRKKLTS